MKRILAIMLSFISFVHVNASSTIRYMDVEDWVPMSGDYLLIDLSTNTGYVSSYGGSRVAEFDVVSGSKKIVNYIGLRYWAETPKAEWTIKEEVVKPDRITFGDEGVFYRLLLDDEFTHYGIHNYKYADYLLGLEDSERYRSMGCILLSKDNLKLVDSLLDVNKKHGLRVVTY